MCDDFDYAAVHESTAPFAGIPEKYNLGVGLTTGNVPRLGDRVALLWENTDGQREHYTYAQLDTLTNQLAGSLVTVGVRRGDRVVLHLPNVPAFYIAALAVAKAGGVFVPSSASLPAADVAHRLADSGAVALITTTGSVDAVLAAADPCPERSRVITLAHGGDSAASDTLDFDKLLADGPVQFEAVDTLSEEPALIAYTSGSTGDPKGVVHRHRSPLAYEGLISWWHDFRPDDVVACPLELGRILPVASTFLYAMRYGLSIVLYHETSGAFNASHWLELIERHRITNFVGTPTIYRTMLTAKAQAAERDLSSLRHAVSSGDPLPAETFHAIDEMLELTVLDGLGMSECMVYCHNMVSMPVRPGSCGRPSPGIDVRVMDENLRDVPTGRPGVLHVRRDSHPGMMAGYWNRPERDAAVFQGEWYVSGDVVEVDADGYVWFKGRAGEPQ